MTLGSLMNEKLPLLSITGYRNNENLKLTKINSFSENGTENSKNERVSVVWSNLNVTALIKKQHFLRSTSYTHKEIIHNVSGCIPPANLIAILGASGSGKSTLMSVLANRQSGELKVQGDIFVNGRKIQIKYMRLMSGFVYQDDLFMPTITVLEHLHFAAQLKLDRRISAESRSRLIYNLLTDVGLLKCANNFICASRFGKAENNLSGGERKRLSVATELLTDPPLLFCDEPTTGLDSFSALKLVTVMKNLTEQRNKTIVCSIHQPNEQIFNLFNYVIMLHKGEIAFCGAPSDGITFFKSIGYPLEKDQNPAEYFIKNLAVVPGNESETAEHVSDICQKFVNSSYAKELNEYIEQEKMKLTGDFCVPRKIQRIRWHSMLYLMTYRNLLLIKRDSSVQFVKLAHKMILAVLVAVCLMGTVTLTQEGIQSIKGALFTLVAENFFPPLYTVIEYLPNQMPLFYREYSNNLNAPLIFYLSNVLALLPICIIDPVLFTTIVYWVIGLRPDFFIFLCTVLISILILLSSTAFGMLMSLMANTFNVVTTISTGIDTIFFTLSGIFVNMRSIPFFLQWIRYVSWMAYGVEALLVLHLQDVDYIACRPDPNLPCLNNGPEVLAQMDYHAENLGRDIFLIFVIFIVLHIASFLVFRVKLYFRMKQ